jgi:hypothetical protein
VALTRLNVCSPLLRVPPPLELLTGQPQPRVAAVVVSLERHKRAGGAGLKAIIFKFSASNIKDTPLHLTPQRPTTSYPKK